jgi:hypothetical protein
MESGANENTTLEFSTDVKIEGQPLPAGKYGFFIAYDPNECTLIFPRILHHGEVSITMTKKMHYG